jgi:hypothetical protein
VWRSSVNSRILDPSLLLKSMLMASGPFDFPKEILVVWGLLCPVQMSLSKFHSTRYRPTQLSKPYQSFCIQMYSGWVVSVHDCEVLNVTFISRLQGFTLLRYLLFSFRFRDIKGSYFPAVYR